VLYDVAYCLQRRKQPRVPRVGRPLSVTHLPGETATGTRATILNVPRGYYTAVPAVTLKFPISSAVSSCRGFAAVMISKRRQPPEVLARQILVARPPRFALRPSPPAGQWGVEFFKHIGYFGHDNHHQTPAVVHIATAKAIATKGPYRSSQSER
jgi:hypothetical protein